MYLKRGWFTPAGLLPSSMRKSVSPADHQHNSRSSKRRTKKESSFTDSSQICVIGDLEIFSEKRSGHGPRTPIRNIVGILSLLRCFKVIDFMLRHRHRLFFLFTFFHSAVFATGSSMESSLDRVLCSALLTAGRTARTTQHSSLSPPPPALILRPA